MTPVSNNSIKTRPPPIGGRHAFVEGGITVRIHMSLLACFALAACNQPSDASRPPVAQAPSAHKQAGPEPQSGPQPAQPSGAQQASAASDAQEQEAKDAAARERVVAVARQELAHAPRVEALDMYLEDQQNTIAAQQKYQGRRVVVSGEISGFDKTLFGDTPFIHFVGAWSPIGVIDGVAAYLAPSGVEAAARMTKGQRISLYCVGIDGHRVKDCTVVPTERTSLEIAQAAASEAERKARSAELKAGASTNCPVYVKLVKLVEEYRRKGGADNDAIKYQVHKINASEMRPPVYVDGLFEQINSGQLTSKNAYEKCLASS